MESEITYEIQELISNKWEPVIYPEKSLPLVRDIYNQYKKDYPKDNYRIIEIITIKKEIE